MSHTFSADLDRAVLLARRAATAGRIDRPEPLTRFLHQRWFLGRTPQADDRAARRQVPAQRTAPSPGPWRTWGGGWEQRAAHGDQLVRIYFACAPLTSLHVVGAVATHAQQWQTPWLLSSRAMSQPVPSADATVLYVPSDAIAGLHEPLTRLIADVQPFLGSTLPALTLPVAPGVAVAQNPADGRSYGEHRCAIIARTVLAHGSHNHRETVERTLIALRRAGVDPRRPYRALDADWTWGPGAATTKPAASRAVPSRVGARRAAGSATR